MDDYQRRKAARVLLEPKLKLPRPYRLLNEDEAREWLSFPCGTVDPTTMLQTSRKWAHWGPLVSFSEIYFSESQTIALVWAAVMTTCGVEGWYLLEKSHGLWSRLLWTTPVGACDSDAAVICGAAISGYAHPEKEHQASAMAMLEVHNAEREMQEFGIASQQ